MSAPGYAILRTIASGGMGTVYLARRQGAFGFHRLVALKRAHGDLERDPAGRRRLVAEAAAASRMHHANVVSVIDVIERADEVWLVLDWIDGASLAHIVEIAPGGRLPPAVAARVVLDASAGLAAAHELVAEDGSPAGLRHRDVSPQNILVGRDGVARLADFGLAKDVDATLTATADRLLEGKLGYVAPELFAGKPFDERCDLYAMAVVAWEALAARRLFRGRTLRELTAEQARPPLLSSVDAAMPRDFDAVLSRALDVVPTRRHATVRAFVDELEAAAQRARLLATPLEVARFVVGALGERAGTVEPTLRTPTTGPMDEPAWPEAASASLLDAPTLTTADVLEALEAPSSGDDSRSASIEDAPTPAAADVEPPRSRRRKNRVVVAATLATASAATLGAIVAFVGPDHAISESASARTSACVQSGASTVASSAAAPSPSTAPLVTVETPGVKPAGSDLAQPEATVVPSNEVVDLDPPAPPPGSRAVRASPKDAARQASASKPAVSAADTVPSVPKNPYRKEPRP